MTFEPDPDAKSERMPLILEIRFAWYFLRETPAFLRLYSRMALWNVKNECDMPGGSEELFEIILRILERMGIGHDDAIGVLKGNF